MSIWNTGYDKYGTVYMYTCIYCKPSTCIGNYTFAYLAYLEDLEKHYHRKGGYLLIVNCEFLLRL